MSDRKLTKVAEVFAIIGTLIAILAFALTYYPKDVNEKDIQKGNKDSIKVIIPKKGDEKTILPEKKIEKKKEPFERPKSSTKNRFYIGEHLFSTYFLGYDENFGSATIEEVAGIIYLNASQRNNKGAWIKMSGKISDISDSEFNFIGTLKIYNPEKSNPDCEQTGKFKFIPLYKNSKYWRLKHADNLCFTHTGDIDIYKSSK